MPLLVYVTVGGNAAFAVQPGLLVGQAVKLYEFAEAIGTNTAPASKPNSNRVFIDPPPALALRRYLEFQFRSAAPGCWPSRLVVNAPRATDTSLRLDIKIPELGRRCWKCRVAGCPGREGI